MKYHATLKTALNLQKGAISAERLTFCRKKVFLLMDRKTK